MDNAAILVMYVTSTIYFAFVCVLGGGVCGEELVHRGVDAGLRDAVVVYAVCVCVCVCGGAGYPHQTVGAELIDADCCRISVCES